MAEVVASHARAGSFHVRKWALHQADRSDLAARLTRAYVDLTSRSRTVP